MLNVHNSYTLNSLMLRRAFKEICYHEFMNNVYNEIKYFIIVEFNRQMLRILKYFITLNLFQIIRHRRVTCDQK